MGCRRYALVVTTALYALLVYGRLWSNQLAHVGLNGNREAFLAAVRWYTIRDIAILTGTYALCVAALIWWKRKA